MLKVQPTSSLLLYSFLLHMQYNNPMPHQFLTLYTISHQKFTAGHAFEVVFASYFEPLNIWSSIQQSLVPYFSLRSRW